MTRVMKRKIDAKLLAWKQRSSKKPLMVFGARQTGKTTSILDFAAKAYAHVVQINFLKQEYTKAAFGDDLSPQTIIANIEALLNVDIVPGETLLFLDEVQACDNAITALKFFCTDAPQYDVIAAGSLLGVHVAREGSFPVGYVDMLTMHPMDFEEYCWAHDLEKAFNLVRNSYRNLTECVVHERMMDTYRDYLMVGGMPEPVKMHANGSSLAQIRDEQHTISVSYVADMGKYATEADTAKIIACWESVPAQLAKESGSTKFMWKYVASGAKADRYATALDWLTAAGLVNKCTQVSEGVNPLKSFEVSDAFKIYLEDTGLLTCEYDATLNDLLGTDNRTARFRGGVAENYVMQQLVASGVQPYYWGRQSTYEVEFIVSIGDAVIPIEVKSGERVRSTSAKRFAEKYSSPYIMHVTGKNFGATDAVKSIPLYAACLIGEEAAGASDD